MPIHSLVFDSLARSYYALAVILLIFSVSVRSIRWSKRNPRRLPLPPGPKGYPIIGNLLEVPIDKAWLTYDAWSKIYGDMIYFNILGQHCLVLTSLERTYDLFEKRSSNYSDRTRMLMLIELMKMDYNLGVIPYGTWWRQQRRAFHHFFHPNAVAQYLPVQRHETRVLLKHLLQSPRNFLAHARQSFAAAIMTIAYGMTLEGPEDPYISNAEEALTGMADSFIPGRFLVDLLPFLKYVPSWVPGAEFQKRAAHLRKVNDDVRDKPFEYVKEGVANGTANPSICATLLSRLPGKDDPARDTEEKIARNISALAYVGGADTTVSAVESFFLAMAMHPEAQKKGQAEIDTVIGQNRLPDFDDRPSLPYINALVKETMRWQMVVPFAVHMASADDEYNGYFIPKGTVVIGNSWSILHDPQTYTDPLEYKPERYLKDGQLDPNVKDPSCAAFGYGRRICPGRHMSGNSLYMMISSILATFDIRPPLDAEGNPIQLQVKVTGSFLSHPEAFDCVITPRSPNTAALIMDSLEASN